MKLALLRVYVQHMPFACFALNKRYRTQANHEFFSNGDNDICRGRLSKV